jgi:hypothetical protein
MKSRHTGLPLAFLLALSAMTGHEKIAPSSASEADFQPGNLKRLMAGGDQSSQGNIAATDEATHAAPAKVSQWFNFLNCFGGGWRRC